MDKYYEILRGAIDKSTIKYDTDRIKKAYEIAKNAHEGQMRKSGDEYIIHPVLVGCIVIELGLDTDSVISALLHDTVEDTYVTYEEIKKEFGKTVAELVDGVTKLGRIPYSSREEQQAENLRKMFLAMSKDIRVILIKLADRLHNMRTLGAMNEQKRRDISLETMEVYAPIAHRLGMQKIKHELEDISLQYLDKVGYDDIKNNIEKKNHERYNVIDNIIKSITERLCSANIKFEITGRVKQIYSIYRKMYSQNKTMDEIWDLYAVRIIVDNVIECYNVLGIIHDIYKPIPGRFKDYISTPKPNMYQSLHTTVIGTSGTPFEVQIRTWEMHKTAEYGIAAHWKYKEGINGKDSLDNKLEWVRQLLELQQDTTDEEEFLKTLKIDLFADEVFVFTPAGDVINLPLGANVIDFAYAIHSQVGNHMIGAKVNGKIVGFDYQLINGDIVEILTTLSENHGPSRQWLQLVKTSEARNKIRQWYKKEKRDENIVTGREDFEREIKRNGIHINEDEKQELLAPVLRRYSLENIEELYNTIGYGGISISKILPKIKDAYQRMNKPADSVVPQEHRRVKARGGIIVEGVDNCLIKFAKCCNPLPGDDIIGFITKGYGVSVHKRECVNVASSIKIPENEGRWISVAWDMQGNNSFQATIEIISDIKIGIMANVTTMIANMHVLIHGINARETKDGYLHIITTIDIDNKQHLESVMTKLKTINGIISVKRANN